MNNVQTLAELFKKKIMCIEDLNSSKELMRVSLNNGDDERFEASLNYYLKAKELISDLDFHINKIEKELNVE